MERRLPARYARLGWAHRLHSSVDAAAAGQRAEQRQREHHGRDAHGELLAVDHGPHFRNSGELWWYLGVLRGGGGEVGIQLSFFRTTADPACHNASRNRVVSTLAIGRPTVGAAANSSYNQTARILTELAPGDFAADPYSLLLGPEDSPPWGVRATRSPAGLTRAGARQNSRQTLRASGQARGALGQQVSARLELIAPEENVLMGESGFAFLPNARAPPTVLGHIAKPRIEVREGSSLVVGDTAPLAVSGSLWLQARRDRVHTISARFTYDGGHFSAAHLVVRCAQRRRLPWLELAVRAALRRVGPADHGAGKRH